MSCIATMQEILESEIKVNISPSGNVEGIDDANEQLLREASWQYNDLLVEVPSEYRTTKIRLLGGRWLEKLY